MKKSLIITSTLLIVAMAAASAFAWGPGKGRGYGSQDCPRYNQQSTLDNLSQEQKDQFSALRQKFIDETYEIRSEKIQLREQMRLLMETSNPDREKLSALSGQITDLQKQMMDKRIDFALEAKKISPELAVGQGQGGRRGGQGRNCDGQRGQKQDCGRYNQ